MWCGIIDPCVPIEHKDVTIGCFASFDWLSFLLQYNPIVRINTTLQWINDSSSVRDHIQLRVPFREERGPPSHTLTTTTTFTNVQPGDIITAECRVDIGFFLRDDSSISPRNSYETNPLYHVCTVNQTVRCKYLRFSPRLLLSVFALVDCIKTANKKLSCRRETARRFISLNILLSHSKLLKVIRNDTVE